MRRNRQFDPIGAKRKKDVRAVKRKRISVSKEHDELRNTGQGGILRSPSVFLRHITTPTTHEPDLRAPPQRGGRGAADPPKEKLATPRGAYEHSHATYPRPSSEARQRATEVRRRRAANAAAAVERGRQRSNAAERGAHIPPPPAAVAVRRRGARQRPAGRTTREPPPSHAPPPRQSLGRRNLDFDEDSAEARKLVESAAATVSAERQEARVAEATQRALTRLNELESAAAAAERRVRGAEEREATLRRVVDAAKADVRSRARPAVRRLARDARDAVPRLRRGNDGADAPPPLMAWDTLRLVNAPSFDALLDVAEHTRVRVEDLADARIENVLRAVLVRVAACVL